MIKHYSIESLREVAGGDPDFMAVVAQTFLDEIPPDLQAMEDAIKNDNKELAYQFAHKMKPNLEMFGIEVLKDITTIESWTKTSKNKASVDENVRNVTSTLHAVFKELKADFDLG
ncbi:MAG: Hpt domain-containing protein [Bacteroidia bacterium]|nr:Hpt domain-containing protein [Bacteroidia bacterium]NNF29865.1 Hpt domain-containing protein [Flavobacteriaceae bacterium]MBT8275346.1 Hpt domain-containing protein [Bacteroidia bacterium]NNJ82295.1 Hpt domain-containing protein [Flavobacteriaceae bacterium]NNK54160.1 Hpt domain-containing protein [Flavobacteriaceae bacterium]